MTDRHTSAIERLRQGNARFRELARANPEQYAELASGQSPFAVVLGCADSRVSPEIAFNAGLGDLFVVRVAGGVADTASIASIEYAVANLGARLVVVLAHQSCGAVEAAVSGNDAGRNLNHLLKHIAPAVQGAGKSEVDTVARRSARINADRLTAESQILREAVEQGRLRIVTAFFHFNTGGVEFE
jgi:carbonic anhydrase